MTIREGRRRGNPNWGQKHAPIAHLVLSGETEFEKFVRSIGLTEDRWPRSSRLKAWVRKHMNHRYVPESLIQAFGFDVKLDNW